MKQFARILVLCSLAALMLAGGALAAKKVYINGIDLNFPPYGYVDKNGEPAGFDVDSVNWMAEKLGFEVKHQPMDWSGIIPALTSGKIDLIASGMSATAERDKVVDFTIPYKTISQVLVVKKGAEADVKTLMNTGMRIGIQRGTTEAEWFQAHEGEYDYELVVYDSSPLSIQDLINGRIAASAMDSSIAKDIAKTKPVMIAGEFGMTPENYAYAVREEDQELREMLNKGLKMIMNDPVWNELKKKYDID